MSERRNRERAGWSPASWMKHKLAAGPLFAQAHAWRIGHSGRMLLIDGNAGDGIGFPVDQADLFDGAVCSRPTPALLIDLAATLGDADVYLCETDAEKRALLRAQYPTATVLEDHANVIGHLEHTGVRYQYALWISDPCGPAKQGIVAMRALGIVIKQTDYVVIFNEGAVRRMQMTLGDRWSKHRIIYPPMLEPQWWLQQLDRKYLARTRVIHQSAGFNFRILVVSNYLASASKRPPFIEIMSRSHNQGGVEQCR